MRILFTVLFSVLSHAVFSQINSENDKPDFENVITEFFTQYSFEYPDIFIKFQKKKDGWHVAQTGYENTGDYFNEQLFWSANTKTFVTLTYPAAVKDTGTIASKIEQYKQLINYDFEKYYYGRNLYYGYPGWDWDIINDSIYANTVTDTLYEALARAYTNYASGFLFDQYGDIFINSDLDRKLLPDKEKINQSRIEKFIQYETKAINTYKKLFNINPLYETRVGNIKLKYANEYLYVYSTLLMAGDSLYAVKFIDEVDYPDSILAVAKEYLASLPLNSILFAGGDNDTYPLWYLQQKLHVRKDVLIMNTSLLGLRRYINMLDKKFRGKLFSTPDSVYYKNNFDYFFQDQDDTTRTTITVNNFIKRLNYYKPAGNKVITRANGNTEIKSESYYKGEILKMYQAGALRFGGAGMSKSPGKNIIGKTIKLPRYLFMNSFMMLDIINHNLSERPAYFTYKEDLFNNLLTQKGTVFKVDVFAQ